MITLAACGGGLIAAGIVLFIRELTRRAPPPGTPPSRVPRSLSRATVVRLLIALTAFLIVLLVTGWPVAALAAALAVIFLPKLASGREARRRTATLEALEQWARRLADMLTASRALEDALEASARSAPPAIAGQVGALARRLSARTGTETALRAFAADALERQDGQGRAVRDVRGLGRRDRGHRNAAGVLRGGQPGQSGRGRWANSGTAPCEGG